MLTRLRNNFMKLWLKRPRYQLILKLEKKHVDSRSYEWYLCRQKFGFDERELWNLCGYFWAMIRHKDSTINSGYTLENYILIFSQPEKFKEELKWYYDRVDKYIEWDCPYGWKPKEYKYLEEQDRKETLLEFKRLLGVAVDGVFLKEDDIVFIREYDRFGW